MKADGTRRGSHGRNTSASSDSGSREAPTRLRPTTATPANNITTNANGVAGSSASLAAPASPGAIVPCESQAARTVSTQATAVMRLAITVDCE
jgi:hypothetical protein